MSQDTEDWLSNEIADVAADLATPAGVATDDDGLELTGSRAYCSVLAAKFAVGFLSKVAGAAAYDRWKKARTDKEIDRLRGQLSLSIDPPTFAVALADPELRHDLVESFVAEGLTVKQGPDCCGTCVSANLSRGAFSRSLHFMEALSTAGCNSGLNSQSSMRTRRSLPIPAASRGSAR